MNEVFVRVTSEPNVEQEISDFFSFMAIGHEFHQAFRRKQWDGRKRLYSIKKKLLYRGLISALIDWADDNGHTVEIDQYDGYDVLDWSKEQSREWLMAQDFGGLVPRDFQIEAFIDAIEYSRGLYLLPTSSGKSLAIYAIQKAINEQTLIIVPTVGLVTQMEADFIKYGCPKEDIQQIRSGLEKDISARIVIGTWQSLVRLDPDWFKSIKTIIVDEVHLAKADSIVWLMENCTKHIPYRYGFTGTLDDIKLHKMIIYGLFSKSKKFITTSELMERDQVSKLIIEVVTLKHDRKSYVEEVGSKPNYHDEIRYIVNNRRRNNFIMSLLEIEPDNTIVFFSYEAHGRELLRLAEKKFPDRKIHFISQKTSAKERERIRQETDAEADGHIIFASFGTSSTGISITSLGRAIFASSFKSRIRNMQSIGRILRLHPDKDCAILYDLADDLRSPRMKRLNHSLRHRNERIKQYASEGFEYRNFDIDISGQ